jgi:hypothetical protein
MLGVGHESLGIPSDELLRPRARVRKTEHMAQGKREVQSMRVQLSAVAVLLLASCAQPPPPPAAYGNVPLAASTEVPGAMVYRVRNLNSLPPPRCFYIPDAMIYNGPDARYYEADEQQKAAVAKVLTDAFRRRIGQDQALCQASGPRVATLQLTLFGLKRIVPGDVSSATSIYSSYVARTDVDPRNLEASVNGSITVGGKFTDSTGTVLAGFVDSVSSDDFDLPLNATPLDIAKLGADQLATEIAQAVNRQIARQKSSLPPSVGGR